MAALCLTPVHRLLIPLLSVAVSPLVALPEQATLEAAWEVSARDGRVVMLECTGSDWCPACIHLRREILDSPEFESAMGDKVVLVSIDYPRTPALVEKISKDEWAEREKLLASYGIRGLPAVIMQDSDGLPFAIIPGARRTTADYLPLVEEALKVKARRDLAIAHAAELQGLERAKALDAALKLLPEVCRDKYTGVIAEIRRLDTEDSLGYTAVALKAERRVTQSESLRALLAGFKGKLSPEELKQSNGQLDTFLQQPDLLPEIRQQALRGKADNYALLGDVLSMHESNVKALEAAPCSELADKLRKQIHYEEMQLLPRLQKAENH